MQNVELTLRNPQDLSRISNINRDAQIGPLLVYDSEQFASERALVRKSTARVGSRVWDRHLVNVRSVFSW